MSMILMLESVSSDTAVSISQQTDVAEKQQAAFPLRIFNGEGSDATTDGSVLYGDFGEAEEEQADGDAISLEKAWHGLHFLLTGDPWGGAGWRAFLLCGGAEQDEDMGYGPARRFEPDEVREINQVLSDIGEDELWSRFDAKRMTAVDIYPGIWDEPEEDLREEYLDYFQMLKEFVAQTADSGDALQLSMG